MDSVRGAESLPDWLDGGWFGLFLQAHFVVKFVMVILFVSSIWSWSLAFGKWRMFYHAQRSANGFEKSFWASRSLDDLYEASVSGSNQGVAALFIAGMREWRRSRGESGVPLPGLQMRVGKVMDVVIAKEVGQLEAQMSILATIASAAPFVGLFGTVWGIMNSFWAIADSGDTSLASVAPGIAEALFATALGLVPAIPASVFYNHFSDKIRCYAARLERFSEEFAAIISRHLDERR